MKTLITIGLLLAPAVFGYNLTDFNGFSAEWGRCRYPGYHPTWDLDRSGCVDLPDLMLFAERWLMSYPNKVEVTMGAESTPDLSGVYTIDDAGADPPSWALAGVGRVKFDTVGPSPDEVWQLVSLDSEIAAATFISTTETYTGAYDANVGATGTATVTEYNETNGDTVMIEIPVVNSVNLINSGLGSTVNFGAMRRKNIGRDDEAWEVFDFNADEWGDQSGENAVTTDNSLSGAGDSTGDFAVQANMRVFLLGIPNKVHETDCILVIVSGTSVLMGLEKPKLSRYPLNPGLVPYIGDGKIATYPKL